LAAMLSRLAPSVRKAASGRLVAAGRFPVQTQAASFHAGPVLRDEEKAEAAPEKKGFLAESLGDWHRAVPLGVLAAIPAVQLDFYMITDETQLFACFMLFVGTAYSLGGNAIAGLLDEKGEAILKEHHAVENLQIAEVEATLATHKAVLSANDDIKAIYDQQKTLMADMVVATELKLQHKLRDRVVTKLNNIVAGEAQLAAGVQNTLVNAATAHVTDAFEKDTGKLSGAALTYAMEALSGKDVGTDAVGGMYQKFVSDFGAEVNKINGTEVALSPEIIAKITDDLESIKRRDGLEDIEVAVPTKVLVNL